MSRFLNFYFSPFENPGRLYNWQTIHLHEDDRLFVPMLKRPFMGGGIDCDENGNDTPEFQNGIAAITFDTTTTPPTIVKDHFGVAFCAKFKHPDYPKFYQWKGGIYEVDGGAQVMLSEHP